MLAKVVERQDLDVDTARDGEEAIERIDQDGYSVIVLDMMMPRVDGYAVLKHMERNHPEMLKCTIIASAVPESEILDARVAYTIVGGRVLYETQGTAAAPR